MKLGLISDIHGNHPGLVASLDAMDAQGVDQVLCLGDVVGYYPFVNETIDKLRAREIACIKGNHDAALTGYLSIDPRKMSEYALDYAESVITPDNFEWIASLPESASYNYVGGILHCYHGSPWQPLTEYVYPDNDDFDRFAEIDADIVALGHTHYPMIRQTGRNTIVNPGSCGQPRDYSPGACYAVIDSETFEVSLHRVSYDIDTVAQAVREAGLGTPLIDILYRERLSA